MTIVRYYRTERPSTKRQIKYPAWRDVEVAIRRMDDCCFPIVVLSCKELAKGEDTFDDENSFNVIGGAGRFALFQNMGPWQYEDPNGSDAEVRLWQSDQGYFCRERNVITDIKKVLRIVKGYYKSGRYSGLSEVE